MTRRQAPVRRTSGPAPGSSSTALFVPPFRGEWKRVDLSFLEHHILPGGKKNFRTASEPRIQSYARMMADGGWQWGEGSFDIDPLKSLINGHNRAKAYKLYLEAGNPPQWWYIRWDCPTEWADIYDSGQNRTNGQRVNHLGFKQYNDISSVLTALWQITETGLMGGVTTPPDVPRRHLGTEIAPTPTADLIHDAVNLVARVHGGVAKSHKTGVTPPSLGAVLSIMLNEDDDAARTFLTTMIRAIGGAWAAEGKGAVAVLNILRSDKNVNDPDRSRYDRKIRNFSAMWLAWREPAITYSVLSRRLLGATPEKMRENTHKVWDDIKDEVQPLAKKVINL